MLRKVVCWGLIIFSLSCLAFTIKTAHFLTPLKLNKIEETDFKYITEYDELEVVNSDKLDSTCYKGSLDDRIKDKNYYNGILNTLCKEYGVNNIKVSVKKATGKLERNYTLAGADGLNHLVFYYNTIDKFNPTRFDMAHIINHEYIHILMFNNMANYYTIDSKSKTMINSVANSYKNLPEDSLFPSDYARDSSKEQIAEILGVYNAKRMLGKPYVVSNFEQDLYNQFMLNV